MGPRVHVAAVWRLFSFFLLASSSLSATQNYIEFHAGRQLRLVKVQHTLVELGKGHIRALAIYTDIHLI